jgi:serine/threonine-protein kinase
VLKGFSIAALIIALLGVGVWLGVRLLGSAGTETVAVPRLEGLTVAKAESELRDVGLLLGGPEVKVSDLPKDTIISQDPRTGELVAVGSIVDVVVSAGKEQVQVPDLIDFTSESDARRALAEAGLTLGKVTPEDSDRPEGTVLRQEPAPYETVDAGSAVDIWVSNAQVEVPNVVGRTEAQARTDLFNLGFEVAYGPELETTEFAPGTVADQTPVGGEKAKKGSLVTLTLAKAPAPTPTPTPTPSVPADGGGADGTGGGGTANGNPGLSATPAP